MQFMMMFYEKTEKFDEREQKNAAAEAYWGAWMSYVGEVNAAGIVVHGEGLQGPGTATTVKFRNEKRVIEDGPFADTKEQLGGYFVIEVKSIDEAVAWAAKAPCAHSGGVELRPVLPPPA